MEQFLKVDLFRFSIATPAPIKNNPAKMLCIKGKEQTGNAVSKSKNNEGSFQCLREKRKQLVAAFETINRGCNAVSQYELNVILSPKINIKINGWSIAKQITNIFKPNIPIGYKYKK